MKVLPKRFEKYKLELHPDKTKIVNLNSKRGEGNRSFDLLGFTHYLGKSRKGIVVLKRKTSSKKLSVAIDKIDGIEGVKGIEGIDGRGEDGVTRRQSAQ